MQEAENFVWPVAPYYAYDSANDGALPAECLIERSDGQKLFGRLLRFLPERGVLEFEAAEQTGRALLNFDRIKSIRLTQPVSLRRRRLEKIREAGVMPEEATQSFTVEFKDGDRLEGSTRGFVTEKWGLYLFPPLHEDVVIRVFLPALAYGEYSIGRSLGELVAENLTDTTDFVALGLQFQSNLRSQRIGDYLTASQILTKEALEIALKGRDHTRPDSMLGETLLKEKLLTKKELDAAVQKQQHDRKLPLGEILVEMGVIDRDTVNRLLVQKLGIPFIDADQFSIEHDALKLIDKRLAEKHRVLPLFRSREEIVVAMENPTDTESLHDLRFYTKLRVVPVMAASAAIQSAIRRHYAPIGVAHSVKDLVAAMKSDVGAQESLEKVVTESDSALVRLVNQVIIDATERKASDIHLETYPGKADTKIRFRQDGDLVHYLNVPAGFRHALISRIKIMAGLDISERRKPQDGKIVFDGFGPTKIELRVATMPTAGGMEDVVMRLLSAAEPIPLNELGLRREIQATMTKIANMPHGLVLICGPTGSGKTTTLHSVLSHINTPERKIWTAEDPVEITQVGLRQVQVNAKIGLTFASAMRAFLRLDPDVIMVGEMRDAETARTGVEASLTGHLVLSTLHTNSAPESIVRLLDLGMDRFNFADALIGVLGQRLARALCVNCRIPYKPRAEEIDLLLAEYCSGTGLDPETVRERWLKYYADKSGSFKLYKSEGCSHCDNKGYKGRVGLHELLVNSHKVRALIQEHAKVEEILKTAIAEGMLTLKQDGIEKILMGLTDITQIRSVAA